MMRSLRARLSLGLTIFILLTGVIAGVVTFRWAYAEALEGQDAILTEVGALVVKNHLQTDLPIQHNVEAEDRLVVRELPARSDATESGDPPWPFPSELRDGLQTIGRDANTWRVLVRPRPDGSRLAVGQLTAYRDEIARGAALRTLLPFAVLIPCLLLVAAGVISYSLHPVSQLANVLDASDHDHLATLPLAGMPEELRPFIQSINGLLRRIATMLDQQRRFIVDAAHELRSPITALSVQAENLAHAELPQESRERLAALKTGIRRTGHLLEQLLALAKYESSGVPKTQIAAFDRIAREVVADLLPEANVRTIDLGFERAECLTVRADPTALAVLVRNLVDNALRYTPSGGRVDIHLYSDNANAVFRVDDTGPGISDADLPHILEPFYRGQHNEGEGTGLGLSIVHQIVRAASGTIEIQNIRTHPGLRVIVTIPLTYSA